MNPSFHTLCSKAVALFFCGLLSGCGLFKEVSEQQAEDTAPFFESDPVPYEVVIKVKGTEGSSAEKEIAAAMEKHSQLVLLKDQLPDGVLGLSRRARTDRENAVRLLHSLGYYDGSSYYDIEEPVKEGGKAIVHLLLEPGERYLLGDIHLSYEPAPSPLSSLENVKGKSVPYAIDGIDSGHPAVAEEILEAVAEVPDKLHTMGYPLAEVTQTKYQLDKANKKLNAFVCIDPGPSALMGDVHISGNKDVDADYLKKMVTWKKGQPWDERRMAAYREELQKTGLFRSVEVKAGPFDEKAGKNEPVDFPVHAEVQEGTFRSAAISGRYATDTGIGIQAGWSHRNLLGAGEKLDIHTPFAQDKRGIQLDFEKPFFGNKDQKLIAGTSFLKEETDAYDTTALNGYVGIERRLSPTWWASIKMFAEQGSVTRERKDDYHYGSVIAGLRRDTRNNMLEPSSGTHVLFEGAPVTGYYQGDFTGFSAKVSASAYYALFEDRKLVLAGRMALGSFYGADLDNIPPSLRFYAGGGGSVRGYAYQAIGPKDKYGDPLGGRSFQEINLEVRYRITERIGIVPFIDGGMIYEKACPEFFSDLQWAVGLGLRYYTPIGPLRFDVAVPLEKKEDDRGYQFYISIGQAF